MGFNAALVNAQSPTTELYDLFKMFLTDSTGSENLGDWAVKLPNKYPVAWKQSEIVLSPDTSINFYRVGTADLTINKKNLLQAGQPVKWYVMLKGPQAGYSSFTIFNLPANQLLTPYTIESLFHENTFKARLLKSCDKKELSGYYYYEMKLPGKDVAYVKLSWLTLNNNATIRIDCYNTLSQYSAKLDCK